MIQIKNVFCDCINIVKSAGIEVMINNYGQAVISFAKLPCAAKALEAACPGITQMGGVFAETNNQ